jgi:hypothetical protein
MDVLALAKNDYVLFVYPGEELPPPAEWPGAGRCCPDEGV